MHATILFDTCPTCHRQFGVQYDKDSGPSTESARASVGAQVRECDHQTGGAQ